MRVPALVGSWPEPFLHGFRGEPFGFEVHCQARATVCDEVSSRIAAPGGNARGAAGGSIDVLVGSWARIRSDPDARLLSGPPSESGIFASFSGDRRALLTLLNQRGEPAGSLGRGAGLVAALRPGDGPPTWVITGTDKAGVDAAAGMLGDELQGHFALAIDRAGPIGVPLR